VTRAALIATVAVAVVTGACATTAPWRIPEGPSQPLAASEAAGLFGQATAACRAVRTLTAEIGLSGRAGSGKLRGRVLAGFERSGAVRLEAPAPFGAPVFILAARSNQSVLWFPRDKRVLRDAAVADVLEALTGMRWQADDLLALLTGCLAADLRPEAIEAKRFDSGWLVVPVSGGAEAFLLGGRQPWRISGGRVPVDGGDRAAASWTVAYDQFAAGFPGTVRVRREPATDMTFRVSQLEANAPIDPAAFSLMVPADAVPMTLDQLRQMGPLADRAPGSGSR
jgi:hypothetical protein